MIKNRTFFLILICLLLVLKSSADITLPSILADNMVLQRNTRVKLWGQADNSTNVKIKTSWNSASYSTRSTESGSWSIEFLTPDAGGPYQISISDGSEKILNNIMIGEVWICSGQSNMVMKLKGMRNQPILNSADLIIDSNNENLRLFTVAQDTAHIPKDNLEGSWSISNPETAREFSSLAYQYGSMLQKKLNVPVGMIVTAWGGTPICSWMSNESLKEFTGYKPQKIAHQGQHPSVLYNGMLHPLKNFKAKGFLWYQGENDVANKNPALYKRLLPAMVKDWRSLWENPLMSFYYVQIAPWLYNNALNGVLIREAQLKALEDIPNAAIAITTDVGSNISIHPPDKTSISKRLLYAALANDYNIKGIVWKGPDYKQMTLNGNKVILEFDNTTPLGMYITDDCPDCFEIAGEDKVFYKADAIVSSNSTITVSNEKVKDPVAVRYAFKDYTEGSLFNTEGLPASSFRTDNWTINNQ